MQLLLCSQGHCLISRKSTRQLLDINMLTMVLHS